MIDIDRLKKLHGAATPGPWAYRPDDMDDWGIVKSPRVPVDDVAAKYGYTTGSLYVQLQRWGVRLSDDERARRRIIACQTKARDRKRGPTRPRVWPECPPHLLADYITLRNYLGALSARQILEKAV